MTDIAIIVVAADDGVKPQTVEAAAHARAAGVPVVAVVTKIDKESATNNLEELKGQLASSCELTCEDWGGDVPIVPVSSKTGEVILATPSVRKGKTLHLKVRFGSTRDFCALFNNRV